MDHSSRGLPVFAQHTHAIRRALCILSSKNADAEQLPRRLSLNLRRIHRNSLEDRRVNRPRQRSELTTPGRGRKEALQLLTVTKRHACALLWGLSAGRSIVTADTVANQGRLRTPEVTTQIRHSAVGLTVLTASAVSSSAPVTRIRIISAVVLATAATIATGMPMMRRLEGFNTLCRRLSERRVRGADQQIPCVRLLVAVLLPRSTATVSTVTTVVHITSTLTLLAHASNTVRRRGSRPSGRGRGR